MTKVLAHAALSTLTVHNRISHVHRRRDPENDRRCVPAQVLQQTITDNAGKHRHSVEVAGASTDMLSRALPIDVVRVGVHVREQAAVTLQKCVREAAVSGSLIRASCQACVTVTATLCTSTRLKGRRPYVSGCWCLVRVVSGG